MSMTSTQEVVYAVSAAALLGASLFGLNGQIFAPKKKALPEPPRPKRRITYIVEDVGPEDAPPGSAKF